MNAMVVTQPSDAICGLEEISNRLQEQHISQTGRRCVPVGRAEFQYILAVPCSMCGDLMDVEKDEINESDIGPLCAICIQRKCDHCGSHERNLERDINGCQCCKVCA